MSGAYYNDNDPFVCAWLRELIKANLIAPGEVDERSIEEVKPDDLRGFTQCHFFAGIGVWSYALRLAGLSDERSVWTGSCPCQPFSVAGKSEGFADERHLWPAFFYLIEQRRPRVVFGEQVASKDGYAWLDLVQTDMEALDYAFGSVVLPAAGFGAPHGRHRIFFVADAGNSERGRRAQPERDKQRGILHSANGRESRDMADAANFRRAQHEREPGRRSIEKPNDATKCARTTGGLGYPESDGRIGREDNGNGGRRERAFRQAGAVNGFWGNAEWLLCKDGKHRPVEPGTFPLVNGTPNRVGRLRGYGNAINAEVAKEFIEAYMSI